MGETQGQIKSFIEQRRDALEGNLDELQSRAREAVDWRAQVRKHPMAMVGVAFAVGVGLSAVARRRSRAAAASAMEAYGISGDEVDVPLAVESRRPRRFVTDQQRRSLSDTLNNFTGALIGVTTAKIKDFIGQAIPGFKDYYDRADRERRARPNEAA
jgi:hypothetical protein